ncbi:MAG: type II secretion system F family protein [bacterium]|nr:type II secretion system F family protein [bacterium]
MQFSYTARTKNGETQNGMVEAATQDAALDLLHRNNLVVVSLEQVQHSKFLSSLSKLFQSVKNKDIVIFSRQLATLFEATVPLVESLRTLGVQTDNEYFRSVLGAMAEEVDAGTAFSQTLAKYPKIFSKYYVSMVESGEVSGRLQESLDYLANHEEKEYALMQKVRGALMYPAVIIIVFILITIFLMIFVIPKLTSVLTELGTELPLPTKILIAASSFFQHWWFTLPLIAGALFFAGRWVVQTPQGKAITDRLLLKFPVLGDMFTKLYISRISENLSTLIKGGLPIIKALDVTSRVVGNEVYVALIKKSMEEVKAGNTISSVFQKSPHMPLMVSQMISVGERSGKLDSILASLSRFYAREVDSMTENLTTLIEPLVILVLGGGVLVLVLSILLPIYNSVSTAG